MITTVNLNRDKHIETFDITNVHVLGKNKQVEKRKVKYPPVLSNSSQVLFFLTLVACFFSVLSMDFSSSTLVFFFFFFFFFQAHHCGAFIQKHSSIVTVFLSLMHSHVFVWFLFLTCTSCTIIIIIIIITIIKHFRTWADFQISWTMEGRR